MIETVPTIETSPDTLKREHLRADIKPIFACVGTYDHYEPELSGLEREFEHNKSNRYADYYGDDTTQRETGFLNAGPRTFVISQIDENSKYSKDYLDCTGLIVVGKAKDSEHNVSFLTHQDPTKFLYRVRDTFVQSLHKRLQQLSEMCEKNTIDAVIVGGNDYGNNYEESIRLLGDEVEQKFGFRPVVLLGMKERSGGDDVYFDTKNRRAYIIRPHASDMKGDFVAPK